MALRSRRSVIRLLTALVMVPVLVIGVGRTISAQAGVPAGVKDPNGEAFPDCGSRTNCVSKTMTRQINIVRIASVITEDGGTIEVTENSYLHAVYRSRVFRFPDDVQVVHDPETGTISIWSASRLGSGDGGVNEARVQRIVDKLNNTEPDY
jgi:uncharacterized protein (DUF1499 family)